jgi:hypothetical protein
MAEFSKTCTSCSVPSSSTRNDFQGLNNKVTPIQKTAGCAPLMSDGRLFTNWTPRCSQVYQNPTTVSSYESRQKFIHGAVELMKQNAGNAYVNARCGPCYQNPDWQTGTMLPERDTQTCDARTCTFTPNNKQGLGLGRQYWNPKMESEYVKKFEEVKQKEQDFFKDQLNGAVNPFGADYMPF